MNPLFSDTFYPTPPTLAQKLIEPLDLQGAYVLEPSAGKGDILDKLDTSTGHGMYHNGGNAYDAHLYACEIVPELRAVLADKGYSLVGEDFLAYTPQVRFSHILMNPPFDHAVDHILHAWEILQDGEIAAIMPATALEGKYLKEQTLLQLIADHGSMEPAGQPFKAAERPTNVEVYIVRLKKTDRASRLEWDIHNDQETPNFGKVGESQEVAVQGFINDLLASHTAARNNFEVYNDARQRLTVYVRPFYRGHGDDALQASDKAKEPTLRWNNFITTLNEQAWAKVLDHPGFQSLLTARARAMMNDFRQRQQRVDFNEANLRSMFDELVAKQSEILEGAVLDAFDTLTEHHKDNRIYFEGWKSDLAWKVNKKVVLPNKVSFSYNSFNSVYDEKLNDVDRALCVVSGTPYADILTVPAALNAIFRGHARHPGETESTFFRIKYFLKGTIHLYFLDLDLLAKFNYRAAKARNWLPPGETNAVPRSDG